MKKSVIYFLGLSVLLAFLCIGCSDPLSNKDIDDDGTVYTGPTKEIKFLTFDGNTLIELSLVVPETSLIGSRTAVRAGGNDQGENDQGNYSLKRNENEISKGNVIVDNEGNANFTSDGNKTWNGKIGADGNINIPDTNIPLDNGSSLIVGGFLVKLTGEAFSSFNLDGDWKALTGAQNTLCISGTSYELFSPLGVRIQSGTFSRANDTFKFLREGDLTPIDQPCEMTEKMLNLVTEGLSQYAVSGRYYRIKDTTTLLEGVWQVGSYVIHFFNNRFRSEITAFRLGEFTFENDTLTIYADNEQKWEQPVSISGDTLTLGAGVLNNSSISLTKFDPPKTFSGTWEFRSGTGSNSSIRETLVFVGDSNGTYTRTSYVNPSNNSSGTFKVEGELISFNDETPMAPSHLFNVSIENGEAVQVLFLRRFGGPFFKVQT